MLIKKSSHVRESRAHLLSQFKSDQVRELLASSPDILLNLSLPSFNPTISSLVPIPMPQIYLTLDDTLAGEEVITSIGCTTQHDGTPPVFVDGSLSGKKAIQLLSAHQQNLLLNPNSLGSLSDLTYFAHFMVISDYAYLASAVTGDGTNQLQIYLNSSHGGYEGINLTYYYDGPDPPIDRSGSTGGNLASSSWYDVAVRFDRDGNCDAFVNGVSVGALSDISDLNGIAIPDIGEAVTIGSLRQGGGGDFKSCAVAQWTLWRSLLSTDEIDTLHRLRGLNLSLKEYGYAP